MGIINRRENLRRVLRGKKPAWVPFGLNFAQWFAHHQKFGTLPTELRSCADYIDAMKWLGCDIFSRNLDGGFIEKNTQLKPRVTAVEEPIGPKTITEYETRYGILRAVSQQQTILSSAHQEEHFVKDWQRDGDAFRALLDQREYDWNEEAFQNTSRRLGEDGIFNVPIGCTPLKFLHWNFGLDYTCLFAADYPEAAKELCDIYWTKLRPVLVRVARHPEVEAVILMDNVDTPFYAPSLAEQFWAPYVKNTADLMHEHGKYLFVHACGKLAGLSRIFAQTGVDGLEGIAHPPLGDWTAEEAQQCHPRFVFIGGFGAHEQAEPSDEAVREFYREYLGRTRKERFIFASSCQTAIHTKWERIKLVRDICREWGGAPS